MTDEEIVQGCIKKNAVAQELLYNKYARRMMGVCMRYSQNREEAEDVLQNSFVCVFENIKNYKGMGSLEGWIRKIMINMSLSHLRKNKKLKYNVELDAVEFGIPSTESFGDTMAAKELLSIIQTLPLGFRTVFNLFAIEGYTHKEIAEILDISEGTSKSQFSRAKAHLQKLIPKEKRKDYE